MANVVATPQPPAVPIGPRRPRRLSPKDFEKFTPQTNRDSLLAQLTVPRGELLQLAGNAPFRLGLKAVYKDTTFTSEGGFDTTLNLGAIQLVQSARKAPEFPTAAHPDVIVWARATSGNTWLKRQVSAIDYEANTVTVSGLNEAVEYEFEVYALAGNGSFRILAKQPAGTDSRVIQLYNSTLLAINEVDQGNADTAPQLSNGVKEMLALAPKWQLQIEVNSDVEISMADRAETLLDFRAYKTPLRVNNTAEMNRQIARQLI